MIFDTGERRAERARRRNSWRSHFALWPVELIDARPRRTAWMEWVEKRSIQVYQGVDDGWPWRNYYRSVGSTMDVKIDPSFSWNVVFFKNPETERVTGGFEESFEPLFQDLRPYRARMVRAIVASREENETRQARHVEADVDAIIAELEKGESAQ